MAAFRIRLNNFKTIKWREVAATAKATLTSLIRATSQMRVQRTKDRNLALGPLASAKTKK